MQLQHALAALNANKIFPVKKKKSVSITSAGSKVMSGMISKHENLLA